MTSHRQPRFFSRLLLACGFLVTYAGVALAQVAPSARNILRVVSDDNYPPYIFHGADGSVDGYLVDLWKLWEAKTGVKVDLNATKWAVAQQLMANGEADVIDTIFRTPLRETKYAFTEPYADLPVPIYVHQSIGGINGTKSLPGFEIGVKDGDACIDKLAAAGVHTVKLFDNYAAIIDAAVSGALKIFCVDQPPADYFLYKAGAHREFRKAFVLYTGQFHQAVRKEDNETLALVERGMAAISEDERAALERKWLGEPTDYDPYLRNALFGALVMVGLGMVLLIWVVVLRRKVAQRTTQLERERGHLKTLIRTLPDLVWLKDKDGVYLSCNPRFEEFFGASEAAILGKTDYDFVDRSLADFFRERDVEAMEAGNPVTNEEWVTFAKDQRKVLLETIKTAMRDANGALIGVLGVSRDITARVAVEDALRESEERYRTAFLTSPDAVNINLLEGGRYIDINDGFTRITGYTREDVLGRGSLAIGVWVYPAERQELVRRVERDGFCSNLRMHFRRKDGGTGIGLMSASLTVINGERCILSITRDVSNQVEAEHALLDAQRIAHLGSYRFNVQTGEWKDSDVMGEIFGIDHDYPRTFEGWAALIHEDDRAAMASYVRDEVIAKGIAFDREYRIVRPSDGQIRWLHGLGQMAADADGRPLILTGTIQDITERKEIEEALRLSEERLRAAQVAAGIGVWDVNARTGDTNWSPEAETLHGQRPGAFGRKHDAWLRYVVPEDLERVSADLASFTHKREGYEFEYRVRYPSGEIRWLLARGRTFFDAAGKPVRALGVNFDITDRKRTAEELARYRDRLEDLVAERTAELAQARDAAEAANRAKSAFLANMSHEIRTPMNGILGMAELVRREGVSPRQSERLDKLDGAAHHLLQIINNILDLSKIESGKFPLERVPIDIGGMLQEVALLLHDKIEAKGLKLVVDSRIQPRNVRGDALRIKQALLNYMTNATKFSERGTIRLSASMIGETSGHVRYRFEVRDEGIGIPEETLPRLFASFEQADNSTTRKYGGTGLGLAITRRLAELMGGEAGASSEPGRGSTFWFTVALEKDDVSAGPAPAPAEDDDVAVVEICAGRTALVADDDPFNREVTRLLLEDIGMNVMVAVDGVEAVERHGASPCDIILMDVQMPRLDGLEATRRIRATAGGAEVPIIGVTANVFAEDRAACFAAGMNDFVGKPVLPEVLNKVLIRWLRPASSQPTPGD